MRNKGPLITLGAVAVLAAVLLAVNMLRTADPPASPSTGTATSATTADPSSAPAATDPPPADATPFPAQATYVGEVAAASGTITLAITVEGDRAVAYACDGDTVESWLAGPAAGGTLNLEGQAGARLDGAYDGAAVAGTLWIGERSWTYTATPAPPPAGLYVSGERSTTRASWIVDQQGQVTGVLRAPDGTTSPAPALGADRTAVVAGTTVTAEPVSGGDEIP